MNRTFVIFFCIITIFLFAETDLEKENLKGKVNTFFSYEYQPDQDTEELNWTLNYSVYGERKEYFNENGMIIKEEIFFDDGNIYGGASYEYDDNNNTIAIKDFGPNNEVEKIFKYNFDENGNMLVEYCYDADSTFLSIWEFFYDENGYKIRSESHDSLENCTKSFEYINDENGNAIEQTISNYGWVQDRTEYTYDSNNMMIENRVYDADDNLVEVNMIEYNENGDYASILKDNLENEEITEYICKYNDEHQMTKAIIYKNEQLHSTDLYEYNEFGYDTKITRIYTDSTDSFTYEYIYDEENNWIEKIEYLNEDPFKRYIQEITYYD